VKFAFSARLASSNAPLRSAKQIGNCDAQNEKCVFKDTRSRHFSFCKSLGGLCATQRTPALPAHQGLFDLRQNGFHFFPAEGAQTSALADIF